MPTTTRDILETHGYRIQKAIADAYGGGGPTKFIITAQDNKVCPICQEAERDGPIPVDQLYSNGKMHPSFHGKTCRCKEVTSDELAASLEVEVTDNAVDVGILRPEAAAAASIREYGSGNGPPNPAVRSKMDDIPPEVFIPLDNDLEKLYRERFLK